MRLVGVPRSSPWLGEVRWAATAELPPRMLPSSLWLLLDRMSDTSRPAANRAMAGSLAAAPARRLPGLSAALLPGLLVLAARL